MSNKARMTGLMCLPAVLCPMAYGAPVLLEEMALHAMLESTTSVLTTLADYAVLNPHAQTNGSALLDGAGLAWTGSYDSAGWRYSASGSMGGAALSMNYTGSLAGSDGTDVVITVAGSGVLGNQALLMNGSSQWLFDPGSGDYLSMFFAQETKIGANSFWGWVVGAELTLGVGAGVVSGLVAGGAITLGTGGTGAPAGVVAGIKTGAVVGAGATVATTTISAAVKSTLAEDQHAAPTAAAKPGIGNAFDPGHQATVVADNGALFADDLGNRYRSAGGYVAGTFTGTTHSVPEPTTAWLVGLGLGLAAALGGRRRRMACGTRA